MRSRTVSVVVLALVVLSCGDGAAEEPAAAPPPEEAVVEEPATAPEPPPTVASPADVVPDLLDFTADAVEGGQVIGAEFAGETLAVWFWAPW